MRLRANGALAWAPALLLCLAVFVGNTFGQDHTRVLSLSAVRFADQFAGATAGAKIQAAHDDLPAAGGTVDARGLEGVQTISSTITVTKPMVLLVAAGTWTVSAAPGFNVESAETEKLFSIIGAGRNITIFNYTGTTTFIRLRATAINPASPISSGTLSGFSVTGGATANTTAIHISHAIGAKLADLEISGFTGTGAAGIWLQNENVPPPDPHRLWTERTYIENVQIQNCTAGIKFTVTDGDSSFLYSNILGVHLNPGSGQVGILVQTGAFLNRSTLIVKANVAAGGTLLKTESTGTVDHAFFDISAEAGSGSPTPVGLDLSGTGTFRGFGQIALHGSNFTNTLAGTYLINLLTPDLTGGTTMFTDLRDSNVNGGLLIRNPGLTSDTANLRFRDTNVTPNDFNIDYSGGALRFFTETGIGAGGVVRGTLSNGGVFDVQTGFRIAGAATTNRCPRGDGTNIVLSSADCPTISSTDTLTNKTIVSPVINTSFAQGSGLKHQRVTTGSCDTAGCQVTLTWAAAFADASYTVNCSVEDSTAQSEIAGLRLAKINSKTATSVVVDIDNTGSSAVTGTVHCIAMRD